MPIVNQQNQTNAVLIASFLYPKSGLTRWVENLLKVRLMISMVASFSSWVTSGFPPIAFRTSSDIHVFFLFMYAIPRTVATASACLPRDRRNFGDSKRWKRKKRQTNMKKVIAPMVMFRYRHPMFLSLVQHSCPGGAGQAARSSAHL